MAGCLEKDFRPVVHIEVRAYKELLLEDGSMGVKRDSSGRVLNELLFEDPKIALGTNRNVLTDLGAEMMFGSLFGLSGSGYCSVMGFGASSQAANGAPVLSHADTHLNYELIADGTRTPLTNQIATQMTQASVVTLNTFTDTTETPNINYYSQAIVMATISGSITANVNQPVNEIGIFNTIATPATPTGTSGVMINHYYLGSTTTLNAGVVLEIIVTLRGA